MKELLTEVRQLRAEMRRMTANVYRSQAMIERLRLQQEQVNRLTLEVSRVRTEISDLKSNRVGLKERLAAIEKKYQVGMIQESELTAAKTAVEELDQREPNLMEREAQLTAELHGERGKLLELNKRLDEIERALLTTSKVEEVTPDKKEP